MELKCCICGTEFVGYGNNAEPIRKGICCDKCNAHFVIASRIIKAKNASYEIIKTSKELNKVEQQLLNKSFKLVKFIPYNKVYENVENEENVVLCIL